MADAPAGPTPPLSGGLTAEAAADLVALLPADDAPPETPPSEATAPEEPDSPPASLDVPDKTEPDEPPTPDLYDVPVDGRTERVTLEELKKGYSRTQDYTRKTQATAADRKAFEADRAKQEAAIKASRDQYAQKIERLDAAIADLAPEEPDFERIRKESPEKFVDAVAEWSVVKEKRAKLATERQKIADEQAGEEQQRYQARLAAEAERLHDAIPELKDEAKGRALKDQLLTYGERQGFTRDEVAMTVDHRLVVMLRKAMLYDGLVEKRDALKNAPKTDTKPAPTLKPGTRQAPQPVGRKAAQEAFSVFKSDPSIKKAASVLEKLYPT